MKPTLLVMAAGMGSRYGGLKQVAGIGPNGETIIDYSIFDAVRAGFGKVVFIIRRDIEDVFRSTIGDKLESHVPIEYVFQELDLLPPGFAVPPGREKPWGTGHAVLQAKNAIAEPFAAINADDFYGRDAFGILGDYLASAEDGARADYCMVGFKLSNTLSDHGSVSRGVCVTDSEDRLTEVNETHGIERWQGAARYPDGAGGWTSLTGDEVVSMNMWGFTPSIFGHLEEGFVEFLRDKGKEAKSEYLIPTEVSSLVQSGQADVKVLGSSAVWFGMTHREDLGRVQNEIRGLIDRGEYPESLWG